MFFLQPVQKGVHFCAHCGTMTQNDASELKHRGFVMPSGPHKGHVLCGGCTDDGTNDRSGREKLDIIEETLQELTSGALAYLFDPEERAARRADLEAAKRKEMAEREERRRQPFIVTTRSMEVADQKRYDETGQLLVLQTEETRINWFAIPHLLGL